MNMFQITRYAALIAILAIAACGVTPTGPAGQPSSTDVNPITGQRGGTSSSSSSR